MPNQLKVRSVLPTCFWSLSLKMIDGHTDSDGDDVVADDDEDNDVDDNVCSRKRHKKISARNRLFNVLNE